VADFLVAHLGAAGVLLREGAVSAYFEEGEAEAKAHGLKGYLAALRQLHPQAPFRLGRYRLKTADWASGWKKHFRPLRIGRRLVVRPSWRRYQTKPGDVVIEIDPGQAFGTGAHASTSLALEAIEELASEAAGRDGSALDIGTGTGILAIALARLGWERVVAVDIDPDAASAAKENMARNGVAERVAVLEGGPEAVGGRFGLIAANLSRPDLLRLRPEMARLAQSGGVLVFSGMLDEHAPEVEAAYLAAGFSLRRLLPGGGWSCLVLEAPK
jgi:ribosomal protein L11 methyltransferase